MKRILIVEDEPHIRELIETLLKEYQTYTFSRYEEVTPNNTIDAYLLDHNIKGYMNGSEWVKKHSSIVIPKKRFLMSGDDSWRDTGIQGRFLEKPSDIIRINSIMEDYFR